MRFSVFAHSSNPKIDTPVCRKSRTYCATLLERGEATVLVDEKGRMCGIHLSPPKDSNTAPLDDSNLKSFNSKATLTCRESELNVQFLRLETTDNKNSAACIRAHQKFVMWPRIGDTKAIRVGIRG